MGERGDQHFFPSSLNTSISGGTWAAAQGDINFYSDSKRHGLIILLEKIAHGAFHDSAERGDPPRCHAHTREVILGEIMQWVMEREARRKHIIWLYGPAGAGKSAIAQTVAELCAKDGSLAASFFFSRTATGRNDSSRIIATLAYQLSRSIPEIREDILSAIEEEPTIFSRSILTQARVLLLDTLNHATNTHKALIGRPVLVVIDGLDECGDGRTQKELLDVLGVLVVELQRIPLILLIASRPEYEIRQSFNEEPLRSTMQSLVLDNNYKPDEDIKRFFVHQFRDIQRRHIALGSQFPSPWPSESEVARLVAKASGQFIFAATVTKFVDSPRFSPTKRLDIVLGLSSPGKDTPFASLDTLYRFILASVADASQVLEVLSLLMFSHDTSVYLQVDVVEELLGFEIHRALIDMHALIFVPPPSRDSKALLRMHHASMYDFLLDTSRSKEYTIDAREGHITLTIRWITLMGKFPSSKFSKVHPFIICINAFARHCVESPSMNKAIADALASFDLGAVLKKLDFSNIYPSPWNTFFVCVQRQKQFDDFVKGCLAQYPPMLKACIPAIFCLPDPGGHARDIFHLLMHAECSSGAEFRHVQQLDYGSLDIQSLRTVGDSTFAIFFKDKARAALYYADTQYFSKLATQLVNAIFPRYDSEQPPPVYVQVGEESRFLHNGTDPTTRVALTVINIPYFKQILDQCPGDISLALFLRDRALQYKNDPVLIHGRAAVAQASLEYVQNTGVQYLSHMHRPHTDICAVCSTYGKAVRLVDNVDDIPDNMSCTLPANTRKYQTTVGETPASDLTENQHLEGSPIVHPHPSAMQQKAKKARWSRIWGKLSMTF